MFSMSRESPRAAKLVSLWPDDLSPIDKMFLHGEKRKRREGNTANAIRRGGGVCGFVEKAIAPGQSECHWAYFLPFQFRNKCISQFVHSKPGDVM